jgi:hypothetical protein
MLMILAIALLMVGCAKADPAPPSTARSTDVAAAAFMPEQGRASQVRVAPETVSVATAGGARVRYVAPVPPQKTVEVGYPALSGKSRLVQAGGNLQAALDAAQPGDEVVLAAGATFTGNYVLPVKSGSGWVVVRAASVPTALGVRMTPQLAASANVAKVVTPNSDPAFRTAAGAARWRLVGFEVAPTLGRGINYGLVVLGSGEEASVSQMPSQIVLDRMYLHGTVSDDMKRCVAFNGASLAAIDSYLADCHGKGFDAQGICGWSGPGPFLIQNNWIEGSGQAIMFGGADPRVQGVSPADITIKGNYLYKPLGWANGKWSVKATFEIKHGIRVLFEGNVLENHWIDAQVGYPILFQTISDESTAWSWVKVQDIMVRNNIIRNSTSGVNILVRNQHVGATPPTSGTARVAIVNNLLINVGKDPINGALGRIYQLLGDLADISIVNNTAVLNGTAALAVSMDGGPQQRLTFVNNVLPQTEYGVFGSNIGMGTAALEQYAPGAQFKGNVLPGQLERLYPTGNFFPAATTVRPYLHPSESSQICLLLSGWMNASRLPSTAGAACAGLQRTESFVAPPDGRGSKTTPATKQEPGEVQ